MSSFLRRPILLLKPRLPTPPQTTLRNLRLSSLQGRSQQRGAVSSCSLFVLRSLAALESSCPHQKQVVSVFPPQFSRYPIRDLGPTRPTLPSPTPRSPRSSNQVKIPRLMNFSLDERSGHLCPRQMGGPQALFRSRHFDARSDLLSPRGLVGLKVHLVTETHVRSELLSPRALVGLKVHLASETHARSGLLSPRW